jgi:GNAT superfamily N-acetyltransferase
MNERSQFEALGWMVHDWRYSGQEVTVLHREPFRWRWIATQVVTYIFPIRRTPENYQSVLDDYADLRTFAAEFKQTWIPIGLQCGYALLPIYLGRGFSPALVTEIERNVQKRWCVAYVPSLFDVETRQLHTLGTKSFWGCVYRPYIRATIVDTVKNLTDAAAMA